MSNKILYSPTEGTTGFWGLRNFPDKPFPDQSEWNYHKKYSAYKTTLESCKSNKLEIVDIDKLPWIVLGINTAYRIEDPQTQAKRLTPGDLFDLPIGYEFKETERGCKGTVCACSGRCKEKVLRLVKTETKQQENVSDNKSPETGNISEHKPYLDSVANLAHKCIQFNDGEMQGFDMVMFESLLPIILKPVLKVPQPEPEESQESMINEIINLWRLGANLEGIKSQFTIQRKKQ